jgi:hypothetical protein
MNNIYNFEKENECLFVEHSYDSYYLSIVYKLTSQVNTIAFYKQVRVYY